MGDLVTALVDIVGAANVATGDAIADDLTHDEAVSAVAFVDLADRGYTDAVIADFDIADWAHRHVSAAPDSFVSLADPGAAVAVFDLGFRNQDPVTDAILEALASELAERGPRSVRPAGCSART